jgi:hypothetical protein
VRLGVPGGFGDLRAYLVGGGVVRVFEYAKGLVPSAEGAGMLAAGFVAVAEVVEDGGLQGGVPVGHAESLPIAGDGQTVAAEVVMGVPDAVEGGGLEPAHGRIVGLAGELEGTLTEGQALLVPPQ